MLKGYYIIAVLLLFQLTSLAQQKDSSLAKELDNVVITATKSERKMGNIAIPTQVITSRMIKATGSLRLQDILQEQTGLTLVNSPLGISLAGFPNLFGAGIQMQGLDPAYTLILIDGEPLVGRNAGILKLGRIAVGNIRQIEIVKGPSSSLYGADAMAGVINIITEKPSTQKVAVQLQYAANNTFSAAVNYSKRFKKTALQLFANRYSTSGYDLDKTIYGKTVDAFTDHSFGVKLTQYLSTNSQLVLSARYFDETQKNNYLVTDQSALQTVTGTTKEKDLGVNLQHIQQLSKSSKITSRLYFNQYTNNSDVFLKKNNERHDALRFFQHMLKPEVQFEKSAGQLKYTSGIGLLLESVDASRYDSKHDFTTFYLYTQEEWAFAKGYSLIAGVRADKRNDFDWRVSPKIALGAQVNDKIFINLSAGLGYRTPDVRQMYALFTNSSVGYTLLGTNVLRSGLDKLKAEGQIDRAADISSYNDATILKAETSTGLNVGLRYTPGVRLVFQANIFRNDLRNLIDRFTLPFNKNNGQSIYSYRNVSRVYTEGISGDVSWKINTRFTASAGYQYLNAKDKDVINDIRKNLYLKRNLVTYRTDTVRLGDYGGLLNRSKHSANLKLMYTNEKSGFSGWMRANYTGRFGFTEKNGSGILDDASEYENGFFLCNLTLSKRLWKNIEIQSGIDNFLDHKNPSLMPNLPGRVYFINVNIDFEKF